MEKSKGRLKLFIENFFAYGAISALNQLIPLIMLPIITRMLADTADYGRYDMFTTIVEMGSQIALLGMYDAMFREYFEREDESYRHTVTSVACRIVLIASVITSCLLVLLRMPVSRLFLGEKEGGIVMLAAVSALFIGNNGIISAPTRMQNKRTVYIVSGLGKAVIYYFLALLLVYSGYNYNGMIIAKVVTDGAILLFFFLINRSFFDLRDYDREVARTLLRIALPIAPVFLIYWVFHSMDKIMITNMMGLAEVGVYSIGAKLAMASQLIYTAFAGGWQYFAFSTMKDSDQVEMTSDIFEYLGAISLFVTYLACIMDKWVFELLFVGDYVRGYVVFPYLFLSPLLLMLAQTAGNQFLVIKKSHLSTICLTAGVLVNLVCNYFGIQWFGIKGAAVATLIGYTITMLLTVYLASRKELLYVRRRFILLFTVGSGFVVTQFFLGEAVNLCYAIIGCTLCVTAYRGELKNIMKELRVKLKGKSA